MKQYRNCILKRTIFFFAVFLIVAMWYQVDVRAEKQDQKTVRVGYVNVTNYEESGEGEYKRGAGYEYLQKISYLTGWKYEYVYGSFTECLEMLAKGEIDLFGDVTYTPERAKLINFSTYPQGKGTYWLYAGKDKSDLTTGDIEKLNGRKIGVTKGSYQEGLLKKWLQDNQIQAEIVLCTGYAELMKKLDTGKLDAIAAPDLLKEFVKPQNSIQGLHLLMAEDNELNAEIAQILLEDEGAVITKRPDAKQIPIIAMTANAFKDDERKCLEAGMNAHLAKPIQIDQVIQTIVYCCENR